MLQSCYNHATLRTLQLCNTLCLAAILTSVACPVRVPQGLEIVNPQAAEKKVSEDNAHYFSSVAAFTKVKKS